MSQTNRGGRPKGAKTRAPVIPINTARLALKRVQERAAQGVVADERIVAMLWCGGGLFGGPIAFDPSKPATPLDPNAQTTLLQRPERGVEHESA